MGRAKTGVNASISAGLPVQQGLQDAAGGAVEDSGNGCSGTVNAGSVSGNSNPESASALTESATTAGFSLSPSEIPSDVAEAPDETVASEYEVPSWAEFRTFVMDNGDKYVRATYPNPPVDLIETIWCGVPVEHHEHARVMTARREWLVY